MLLLKKLLEIPSDEFMPLVGWQTTIIEVGHIDILKTIACRV